MSSIAIASAAVTALGLAAKLPELLRKTTPGSLVEFTRPTRVEPIVLVDERLSYQPYAADIMHALASMFSGYYLQAVALSVNVGKVETLKLLDSLNPNRTAVSGLGLLSLESYQHQLPTPGETVGLEHYGLENDATSGRDALKTVGESTNLSVGKMLEVHIESEGQKATFPVQVRLLANLVKSPDLVHILTGAAKDRSFRGRLAQLMTGQISFVREFLFAQDLIDEYRTTSIKDPGGIWNAVMRRQSRNRLSALLSGTPSVADASNMLVFTEETRKEYERAAGGRLKDYRTRERIFSNSTMMLMVVVDTEWEQVTIYHRGMDIATELSVKEIKSANKGSGPDVTEILKAYQLGQTPGL